MGQPKTPLRYPGGKQRLWKFVDEVLVENDLKKAHYVEPYAGGAGVAFELLLRDKVETVHLNDTCHGVYSFWHSILNHSEEFCRKIAKVALTVEEWKRQRDIYRSRKSNTDRFAVGFATFYLNRCNRSGILNAGVIGGLNQGSEWGIDARFPREQLITRIELIARRKGNIKIRRWNAESYLDSYVANLPKKNTLIYFDPPYFRKADRLYPNYYSPEDHKRIAKKIQALKHKWLVSYDACEEIIEHYAKRRHFIYSLQYNACRAYKGSEVFVFSDGLEVPQMSDIPAVNAGLATAF